MLPIWTERTTNKQQVPFTLHQCQIRKPRFLLSYAISRGISEPCHNYPNLCQKYSELGKNMALVHLTFQEYTFVKMTFAAKVCHFLSIRPDWPDKLTSRSSIANRITNVVREALTRNMSIASFTVKVKDPKYTDFWIAIMFAWIGTDEKNSIARCTERTKGHRLTVIRFAVHLSTEAYSTIVYCLRIQIFSHNLINSVVSATMVTCILTAQSLSLITSFTQASELRILFSVW